MRLSKPLVILCSVLIVVLVAVGVGGYMALTFHKNSDALWRIISQQCVPNQQAHNNPAPCSQVDLTNGFVVLKDRNGPLQFLLMPTERISGIESPVLLHPTSPNYIAEAWHARNYVEQRYGKPLSDTVFALTINSPWGRSQNQLHIHISCLRPDIRQQLDVLAPQLDNTWRREKLGQHQWLIRTITRDQLNRKSPFLYFASGVPGAREEMGHYGMAVASLNDGRQVIMVIERSLLPLNRASAEEIQDHSCALVYGNPPATATAG